jgi:hypothetical protein
VGEGFFIGDEMDDVYVTIYSSVGGFRAVIMSQTNGPMQTGTFGFDNPLEAEKNARTLADCEDLEYIAPTIEVCERHPKSWKIDGECSECAWDKPQFHAYQPSHYLDWNARWAQYKDDGWYDLVLESLKNGVSKTMCAETLAGLYPLDLAKTLVFQTGIDSLRR